MTLCAASIQAIAAPGGQGVEIIDDGDQPVRRARVRAFADALAERRKERAPPLRGRAAHRGSPGRARGSAPCRRRGGQRLRHVWRRHRRRLTSADPLARGGRAGFRDRAAGRERRDSGVASRAAPGSRNRSRAKGSGPAPERRGRRGLSRPFRTRRRGPRSIRRFWSSNR